LKSCDAAIYLRDDPIINQMVAAGVMAVAPTRGGRAFIDFVASYILHFESRKTARWFLDQMALIAAYTWLKNERPDVHIRPLPRTVIDWSEEPNADSLIRTQKGGEKRKLSRA
jgi:hypothetical protein